MIRKILLCEFLIILIFFSFQIEAEDKIVNQIWIVIDQLDIDDVINTETKNIDFLFKKGAFGLLNIRTADRIQPESTYLSLNTGKYCKGSKISHIGENYQKGVFNSKINDLKLLNKNNYYLPSIGLFGKLSRENGIDIAVIGNSDTMKGERRTIVSLAMDENGFVPYGDVSSKLLLDSDAPWGYVSNYELIFEKYRIYKNLADVIFIETGDISRIREYNPENIDKYIEKYLLIIDDFIGKIIDDINLDKTMLSILVPTPADSKNKLSFLMITGKDYLHGCLSSASSRRKGIIIGGDLIPTVLNQDINQHNINGHCIDSFKKNIKWEDINIQHKKINKISFLRPYFIKAFIALQLTIIILTIISLLLRYKKVILKYVFTYLLIGLLMIPFNYMLISQFYFINNYIYLILLFIFSLVEIIIINKFFENSLIKLFIITLLLILTIIFDLVNGYRLLGDTLLGYSSIIGARYFGIGNEYMGLLIGAFIINICSLYDYNKYNSYYWIIILSFLLIFIIGSPYLGANFGGMVTAGVAGFVLAISIYRKKFNYIKTIVLLLLFFSFILIIIYMDYKGIKAVPTHIGQTLKIFLEGNYYSVFMIIVRKIKMNIKLMRYTIWTRVLVFFILYLIVQFLRPKGRIRLLINSYPVLSSGYYAVFAASITTFLINDSGVVAAATVLFYPIFTLLYLIELD